MGDAAGRARACAAVAVVCVGLATTSVSSAAQPPLERSSPPAVAAGHDEFELDRPARVQQRDVPLPLPDPAVSEDISVPEDSSVVEPIDDPTPDVVPAVAPLAASGIPAQALAAYQAAAQRLAELDPECGLSWPLLAAIGRVESNHARLGGARLTADGVAVPPIRGPQLDGSGAFALIPDSDDGRFDGDTDYDRAVGPMQFLPGTWRGMGMTTDPQDIDEATVAAGRYLCSAIGVAQRSGTCTAIRLALQPLLGVRRPRARARRDLCARRRPAAATRSATARGAGAADRRCRADSGPSADADPHA